MLVRVFANDVDFQRSTSPGDSVEAFYLRPRRHRSAARTALRHDHGARSDVQILPLPDARRQLRRLLRRERPLDPQVPAAQADRRRRNDLARSACAITRSCTSRACTPASTGRAPIGTPIFAAGNGVIIKAGWDSGYGRRVEIQHANGYVTTYNHMSGFGRGVVAGRARHAGPGRRLSRPDRPRDRTASALRGDHQRQLRRPDGDQARPHARVRRQDAGRLQTRARPHRPADGAGALRRRGRSTSRRRPRPRSSTERDVRRRRVRGRRPKPSARADFAPPISPPPAARASGGEPRSSTTCRRRGRARDGDGDSAARGSRAAPAAADGPRSRHRDRVRARCR